MRSPLVAILAVLFLCAVSSQTSAQDASAADRRIVVTEGADYYGFDYRIVKNTSLEACKRSCLSDNACRAFTFDTAARWCFLKSDFAELVEREGAVAGRVVARAAAETENAAPPALTFLPRYYMDEAERYKRRLGELDTEPGQGAHGLWQAGITALGQRDARAAADNFRLALGLEPDVHALWTDLVLALVSIKGKNYTETARLNEEATSAALNAYVISVSTGERARALALLANTLERRQLYRPALEAYKASLLLRESAPVREAYARLHAQHGFRIVDYSVDSNAAQPRICIRFSEDLQTRNTDFGSFLTVNDEPPAAVNAKGQQICIDGAKHGQRYTVTLRAGVPSRIGEALERDTTISVYVRDRAPMARFTGRNYVLPRFPDHGIPVITVNTSAVKIRLMRVGDRALMDVIGDGRMFEQLLQPAKSVVDGFRIDSAVLLNNRCTLTTGVQA